MMNMLKIKHLLDMKNVQRMGNIPVIQGYNLLEHGFIVGFLFRYIASADDVPYDITVWEKVFLHDIVETTTGDLNYCVKNFNSETATAWEKIEEAITSNDATLTPYTDKAIKEALTPLQHSLFKVCDYLDLYIYCHNEQRLGNGAQRIERCKAKCLEIITFLTENFTKFPTVKCILNQIDTLGV